MRRLFFTAFIVSLLAVSVANSQTILVKSYYGIYDADKKNTGFPSKSLTGPIFENWNGSVPAKSYHIGILVPHLKDTYWVAADYGITSYAQKLNLQITFYSAGAYINFGNQRLQLLQLAQKRKVDGIVLAGVDYDKLDPFVEEITANGTPVVALINDIRAPTISAKSMVSFFEMGKKAGEYVLQDSGAKDIKIAFFPGPENSGWAPDTYQGFLDAVAGRKNSDQKITIVEPLYGDTRPDVQRMRLEILNEEKYHGVDYIVGNAVAAVEAVVYLKNNHADHPKAKVVATYLTPDVFKEIQKGLIQASPSDQILNQCRIALDMVVKILNGEEAGKDFPFRVSPLIPLVTIGNIQQFQYEKLFGPPGYQPSTDTL
jgi:protein TorT